MLVFGFMYLVSVDPMDRSITAIFVENIFFLGKPIKNRKIRFRENM